MHNLAALDPIQPRQQLRDGHVKLRRDAAVEVDLHEQRHELRRFVHVDAGLFRTMFQLVNERASHPNREDWYSQHLYTVCHVLEALPLLPELRR